MQTNCLVLFSGGLDSILACKVLEEQGIRPIALQFVSPFFGHELLGSRDTYCEKTGQKYGLEIHLIDITEEFLKMVIDPPHGYGRYLNPCIDCKILMVKKALSVMKDFGATFIATGEVVGQRPMSQRKDTLRIIERQSGAEGLLLRPLSARYLPRTLVEKKGIVRRELLPAISGRGRKQQMKLAGRYNIHGYPAPAGGCVLTDPILSERFKKIFETWPNFTKVDCIAAQTGRHFLLNDKSWVMVGRKHAENLRLESLSLPSDILIKPAQVPGPSCILRYPSSHQAIEIAGSICARYCKHDQRLPFKALILSQCDNLSKTILVKRPATDQELKKWRF